MAVILQMTYMKKLGLPNFSSHSCSVSLTVEIPDASQAAQESSKLYSLLQSAVDAEIQHVGYMPDASTYGMKPSQNGNGHPSNGKGGNGHPSNGNGYKRPQQPAQNRNGEAWSCTDGQKGFILRIVSDNGLNKEDVEATAQQLFGLGVKELDKMQASQLIEELLEKHGGEIQWAAALEPTAASTIMIAVIEPIAAAPSPEPTLDEVVQALQKTVSASRLSLYLSCRLKFFFRYVLGLKKPKSAALHVGSAVHSVLKAWNKARWKDQPLTLKDLHDQFTKAWADTEEPVEWDDGDEKEQKITAWKLIEIYTRQANPAAKPEFVEVPVESDLHEHGLPKLIGVLDLVQSGVIIDYKTSGQTPNAEKVAHTNEVQTSIYSLLYRENTGKRENGIELHHLVKLKTPKVVITALPPMIEQKQSRLFSMIESYVQGLERRDFVPAPGLQCVACEFFHECRAWS